MADEQKTGIDDARSNGEGSTPGEPGAPETQQETPGERQLQEVIHAYERARDELNEAIQNVRTELAKIDFEQARTRARSWVDENPTLAVFLGIGAGILTGRLISNALHPEPPPLSVRARRRAQELAREGGEAAGEFSSVLAAQIARALHEAGDVGAAAAKQSGRTAEALGRKARTLGDDVSHRAQKAGKDFSKRAEKVGKDISKRAEKAGKNFSKRAERAGRDVSHRARDLGESVSHRADHLSEALSDTASRSFLELEDAAHQLSKTMKKSSKRARKSTEKRLEKGADYSTALLTTARTAVAAVVLKRINDWMKAVR